MSFLEPGAPSYLLRAIICNAAISTCCAITAGLAFQNKAQRTQRAVTADKHLHFIFFAEVNFSSDGELK